MTTLKPPNPKSQQLDDDSNSLELELDRRHRESEKALIAATEEEDDEEQRDSLISFSDMEELTGNVARQTAQGVAEGLKSKHPKLEVSGSWKGFAIGIKGAAGRVLLVLVIVLVIIIIGLLMQTPHGHKILAKLFS